MFLIAAMLSRNVRRVRDEAAMSGHRLVNRDPCRALPGELQLLISEFKPPVELPEKLAIRLGRICLFSIICAGF
jgi:hypothetical protein